MIDGKKFYRDLTAAIRDVEKQLKEAGVEGELHLAIYGGVGFVREGDVKISLSTNWSDSDKTEGKDLQAMVEEVIRREGFRKGQKRLQLAGPVIEGEGRYED